MAWRALPIRTFRCDVCDALHDESCPPMVCPDDYGSFVSAAEYGLPPTHRNQHGRGLVVLGEAESWVTRRIEDAA